MKTVKIPVSQVTPNMIVADSIYTFNNHLIINAGTRLTDKIITRLKFYSIQQIKIQIDDQEVESVPDTVYSQDLYLDNLKKTQEFKHFNDSLLLLTNKLIHTMDSITKKNGEILVHNLYDNVNSIVKSCRNGLHVFDMLHCIRGYDDPTYIHCVNVAVLCNVMATWLNFNQKDLEIATLCGLLHDIGKVTIPKNIISKPSELTYDEYSTIKTHTIRGYNILRPLDLNIHIKVSAMMHHERCDGTGYPMGLHQDKIDRFAKLVMIADVYDAMTSARVYRGPLCPFEVISEFESDGLKKYDPKYLMTFFDHITELYLNSTVKLSDGSVGTIIFMNRNAISKPVIKIGNEYIDLMSNPNLQIVQIL